MPYTCEGPVFCYHVISNAGTQTNTHTIMHTRAPILSKRKLREMRSHFRKYTRQASPCWVCVKSPSSFVPNTVISRIWSLNPNLILAEKLQKQQQQRLCYQRSYSYTIFGVTAYVEIMFQLPNSKLFSFLSFKPRLSRSEYNFACLIWCQKFCLISTLSDQAFLKKQYEFGAYFAEC